METSLYIGIPKLTFAAPAFDFEVAVIIEPINYLHWLLFGLASCRKY